jgi:hypothetical protein
MPDAHYQSADDVLAGWREDVVGGKPSVLYPVGGELPPMHGAEPVRITGRTSTRASKPKGKRSSRGRFRCINAFLDETMASLDRAALAVWLLLWRDTKPDGLTRTSQANLARRAGCPPGASGERWSGCRAPAWCRLSDKAACSVGGRSIASSRWATTASADAPSEDMRVRHTEDVGVQKLRTWASYVPEGTRNAVPCLTQGPRRTERGDAVNAALVTARRPWLTAASSGTAPRLPSLTPTLRLR